MIRTLGRGVSAPGTPPAPANNNKPARRNRATIIRLDGSGKKLRQRRKSAERNTFGTFLLLCASAPLREYSPLFARIQRELLRFVFLALAAAFTASSTP